MQYLIEDFIEKTNASSSREEVFALYNATISLFGFDSAVYTFVTDHVSARVKARHGIQCNYPTDWMAHYKERNYEAIDPVICCVRSSAQTFTWKDLVRREFLNAAQAKILREAEEAMLYDGVGIPLYGARGELAGVGLASRHGGICPDRNMLSRLRLITEQFHLVYCSLEGEKEIAAEPLLSPREAEVLKWWAVGKTADEISIILGCSKPTIKWHIQNVYHKLDANSKILAITKAIRLGLITLDIIRIP